MHLSWFSGDFYRLELSSSTFCVRITSFSPDFSGLSIACSSCFLLKALLAAHKPAGSGLPATSSSQRFGSSLSILPEDEKSDFPNDHPPEIKRGGKEILSRQTCYLVGGSLFQVKHVAPKRP